MSTGKQEGYADVLPGGRYSTAGGYDVETRKEGAGLDPIISPEMGKWLKMFAGRVQERFANRVVCIGLQGSHARGEARADSDIDLVVILDRLDAADIAQYREIVDGMPQHEKMCGFLAGREELENWDRADLFQFCRDTLPVVGSLGEIAEKVQPEDIGRAVRIGACNLYHMCVHNMLYEKDPEILRGLYKSAVFTLQAKHCLETGCYLRQHAQLREQLRGADRELLLCAEKWRAGQALDGQAFAADSVFLFEWAGRVIRELR